MTKLSELSRGQGFCGDSGRKTPKTQNSDHMLNVNKQCRQRNTFDQITHRLAENSF